VSIFAARKSKKKRKKFSRREKKGPKKREEREIFTPIRPYLGEENETKKINAQAKSLSLSLPLPFWALWALWALFPRLQRALSVAIFRGSNASPTLESRTNRPDRVAEKRIGFIPHRNELSSVFSPPFWMEERKETLGDKNSIRVISDPAIPPNSSRDSNAAHRIWRARWYMNVQSSAIVNVPSRPRRRQ